MRWKYRLKHGLDGTIMYFIQYLNVHTEGVKEVPLNAQKRKYEVIKLKKKKTYKIILYTKYWHPL